MKKIVFLTAAAMLWGCGGAADESQDVQSQETLAQQKSSLDGTDPILGNWAWNYSPGYKVTVNNAGYGTQVSSDCFNGAVMWKGIVYKGFATDGVSRAYSGSTGANPDSTYCTYTAWNPVRFVESSDGQSLKLIYSSTYAENWSRW